MKMHLARINAVHGTFGLCQPVHGVHRPAAYSGRNVQRRYHLFQLRRMAQRLRSGPAHIGAHSGQSPAPLGTYFNGYVYAGAAEHALQRSKVTPQPRKPGNKHIAAKTEPAVHEQLQTANRLSSIVHDYNL
jgi:hypothetical protein